MSLEEADLLLPEFAQELDPGAELPEYLDSTMISTFRSCPRKFYWTFVQNLRPAGNSIHLAAGSAFAKGLEVIRNLQAANPDGPLPNEVLWEAAVPAALRAYGDLSISDPESPKNIHNVLYALELYLNEFHPYYDQVQPLLIGEKPTTEFSFSIPLNINHPTTGHPFLYVGRFDMLGKYSENDLLVVLDDKTASSLGSYWLKQWDMRGQFLGYLWACQKLGFDVNNVVVRGIGLLKTETNFLSLPLTFSQGLIRKWENELYNTIRYMIMLHEQNYYPYNFADACSSFGGCPYQTLCQADDPSNWLNNYKIQKWNPVLED